MGPKIDAAIGKEIHYFDGNYEQPKEWYLDRFPSLAEKNGNLTGEATPYYIFHPLVPDRIRKMMPKTKIIILLRNPVDRAYSHYHHAIKNLGETLSFEEAIEKEEVRLDGELEKFHKDPYYHSNNYMHYSYLKRGIYVDQLKAWYNLFPKKQILVLQYEAFFSEVLRSMKQVTDFLRIELYEFTCETLNKGEYSQMNPETRKQLRGYFRPHNDRLYKFLRKEYDWD